MPRQATVYRVLIASPSGLPEERQAVRNVFYKWNVSSSSSTNKSIMFEPVLWEEDVHPEFGRPQSVVNEQLVKSSDLMIAIFWNRLGTPTGNFKSGTIEEIDLFLKEEKPSMIYFSEKPILFREKDQISQIEEVLEIKEKYRDRAFVSNFENIDDFKDKLFRDINSFAPKLINGTFKKGKEIEPSSHDPEIDKKRLMIQAGSLSELDYKNIKEAISKIRKVNSKKTIKVLDVGCASGYVTHSRFNEFNNIQVVGIDKSKAAIEEANRVYADEKFSFTNADIEDDHFYPESSDLIFCSFVLHHLAKPESILNKLWSGLNPHGCLIVNTVDDGTIINWPQDKDLEELIQKTNKLKGSPNRLHGREIYKHLKSLDPEPESVKMEFDVLTTANMTKEARRNYFLECHSFRVDYAKRAANRSDSTKFDKEQFEIFKRIADEQMERFINEEGLFALEVTPIAIAYKA